MKKHLVVLFLIITCATYGQLQKGNMLIGGSLLVHPSKESSFSGQNIITKKIDLSISPRLGVFISDKTALGLELGYNYSKIESEYPNTNGYDVTNSSTKESSYVINPFVRNYFSVGDKFSFFLHSKAGVSFGKSQISYTLLDPYKGTLVNEKLDYDNFSGTISVSPGLAFFASSKWSIEATFATLGYTFSNNKPKSGDTAKSYDFIFNYGLSAFNFGVAYYINK